MPTAPRVFSTRKRPPAASQPKRLDTREGASARGYDATWSEFRALVLPKHRTCEHCTRYDKRVVPTHEIDHVIPILGPTDPLRLDPTNVRGLCRKHHARKTKRFDARIRAYFDKLTGDGMSHGRARAATIAKFRFPDTP